MDILSKMNLEAHKGRPLTPENKKLTLWRPSERFMHCCIESQGCRFNRNSGACVMCDYGIGRNLNPVELERALQQDLQPFTASVSTMLFGSYGSLFDTEKSQQNPLLFQKPIPRIVPSYPAAPSHLRTAHPKTH